MAWGRSWYGRSYDLGRMSFRELLVAYATYPAIHLYLLLILGCLGLAAWSYDSIWQLAAAFGATLLCYPFVEYALHRFVLHGRWLFRMKWTAGLWKRIHFDHHQDPHRLEVLFGSPVNVVPTAIIITWPLGFLIGGLAGLAIAFATGLALFTFYEFCHCVQHLNYKPRSRYLKRIKQLHLAHHFHAENGNFGVIGFFVDRLFGTFYEDARARPKSPNTFNLGYDLAAARRYPWVMTLTGSPPRDRPPRAGEGAGDLKAAS